ncbi:MAG TPA: DUF2817 domain-containing protein, partial [Polyangiales bacterium]|nr:DUF2817 domain-containing protein [Polyangiales bacterium]
MESLFCDDYHADRAAFERTLARFVEHSGRSLELHRYTVDASADLSVTAALLHARSPERLLVLVTGIHGVEGYAGAAVVRLLLSELLLGTDAERTGLLVVHALNPYGFAWDRRVNEDNADINRNFVDHDEPPENAPYAALAEWIAPKDMSRDAVKAANARLKAYSDRHGDFALQEAVTKGQYVYPDGLYYGGSKESWSSLMLRDVLKEELRGVKRLVVID